MKALLARFARQSAVGLCISEQRITISRVAATPLGPIESACRSEPYAPDQFEAVLRQLLGSLSRRRKLGRLRVALGLSLLRVFFSTRPIRSTDDNVSPHVLLHEVLQSPNLSIDDMAIDVIKAQPGKRKVASIVSCRKKYLSGLVASLESCGVRPFRAEPDPCALLRAAAQHHRAPRKAKTVLRILLNERRGLAMVVAGTLPIVWRCFALPPGQEQRVIRSMIRTLQTLMKHCGIESTLDAILVHGRKELSGAWDKEEGQAAKGPQLLWFAGPPLAETAVAYGLALGCLNAQGETFDLARTFRPPASLSEIFPWREVALQLSLLGCMALFLYFRGLSLEDEYQAVKLENARRAWLLSVPEVELEKEKKDLSQKVAAIQAFLSSRVLWSAYTYDIATRLTARATLSSFNGTCEFDKAGGKTGGNKAKKSLVLHATVPVQKDGPMPQEIDDLLSALRADPVLKHDFPGIELADIRSSPRDNKDKEPVVEFTVVALPTKDSGPPSGGAGKAPDKRKGN